MKQHEKRWTNRLNWMLIVASMALNRVQLDLNGNKSSWLIGHRRQKDLKGFKLIRQCQHERLYQWWRVVGQRTLINFIVVVVDQVLPRALAVALDWTSIQAWALGLILAQLWFFRWICPWPWLRLDLGTGFGSGCRLDSESCASSNLLVGTRTWMVLKVMTTFQRMIGIKQRWRNIVLPGWTWNYGMMRVPIFKTYFLSVRNES